MRPVASDTEGVSLAVECALKPTQSQRLMPPLLPPIQIVQAIIFSNLDYSKALQMGCPASLHAPP